VYWTVLCYHPHLVSILFADLLSLIVTFLIFLFLFMSLFFSSRCMLELKFAIYYRAAGLPSQASYAVLAEESQASSNTPHTTTVFLIQQSCTVLHLQTWFTHRIKQLTTYIAKVICPTHLFLPYLCRRWCNSECTQMSIRIHSHAQRVPAAWVQAHWSIQGSVGMIYWDILCLDTKNTNKNTNLYIVHPHTHTHTW